MTIDIHEAKARLSRLVGAAARGQEVIVARAGRPLAKLVPLSAPCSKKTFGLLKGRIRIGKDFDAPLDWDMGPALAASAPRTAHERP